MEYFILRIRINTKVLLSLFAFFVSVFTYSFGQGQFPITADIGYAAARDEVSTHFLVPGATAGSAGDPYSNQVASGSYSVYYATNNNSGKIKRPIIIAEGFDPTDIYSPEDILRLLNGDRNNSFDDLANNLRGMGYDLIVLDYNDGGDLIQRNAFLLVKLIQHINSIKEGACPVILAGYSMGGIVARYALNYMESRNLNHNVGLYFSFDSPQKGANVPIGMQDLVNFMDNNIYSIGLSVDIRNQARSIHSYAAQQMLIYHTDNLGASPQPQVNTRFTKFYDQMKGLVGGDGYPRKCKKIAASLGSWTGLGQSYIDYPSEVRTNFTGAQRTQNAIAFAFDAVQNIPFAGYAIAGKAAPLAYNISPNPNYTKWGVMSISINSAIYTGNDETAYPNASIPADIMPGSFTPVFRDVAQALSNLSGNSKVWMDNGCFIPTISALDFNSSNWFYNISTDSNPVSKTPFSSIFAGGTNRNHNFPVTNNNALVNWVVNEVNQYGASMICSSTPPPTGCNFTEGQYLATFAATGEQIYAHYCGSTLFATTSAGTGGGFKPRHWIEAIGYSQFACFAEDQPNLSNCSTINPPSPSGCNFTEGQYLATFAATGEKIYAHYCGSTLYATTSAASGGGFKPRHWIEAIGYSQFACFAEDQPNLSNCGGSGGGGTGGSSFSQCIEAESSSGSGAITSDPAASNGQTRGEENNYNHYVDYSVTGVPSAGNYMVTLRYYSSAVPVVGIQVNGGSTQSITVPNTNSWNIAWSDYTFTVNLNAGSNTVRILGVGGGSCRQDRICVTKPLAARIGSSDVFEGVLPLIEKESDVLVVSPNPNSGRFDVSFDLENDKNASLHVYDMTGKVVHHKNIKGRGKHVENIDISGKPAGIYLISVKSSNRIKTSRVVVTQ